MASANPSQAFSPEELAPESLIHDVADVAIDDPEPTVDTGADDEIEAVTEGAPGASAASKKKDKRKGRRGPGKKGKGKQKEEPQLITSDVQDDVPVSGPPSETSTVPTVLLDDPETTLDFPRQRETSSSYIPSPFYELRPVPVGSENHRLDNKHLRKEQKALYATQDLKAGTCIIEEAPLITLPPYADDAVMLRFLRSAFASLPKHDQDRIWALNTCSISASPLLEKLAAVIDASTGSIDDLDEQNSKTASDITALTTYNPQLAVTIATFRILARYHLGMTALNALQDDGPSRGTGLFVESASLRHSCVPNCYLYLNPTTNLMTVHTTTAVQAGEELTICTLSAAYYSSAAERAPALKRQFRIDCHCAACSKNSPEFTTQERARTDAYTALCALNSFCTAVPIHRLLTTTPQPPAPEPSTAQLQAAEHNALNLIKHLRTMRCTDGVAAIYAYDVLVDRVHPRLAERGVDMDPARRWGVMAAQAGIAVGMAERCLGRGCPEVERLVRRRKRIEGVLAGM